MAGPSWLVDSNRIATKIRSASGSCEPGRVNWKSNPTKACPNCQHIVDNSDVTQEWPGLPRGVKFDPSDQEIIWHLLAKSGVGKLKPHPFIDEFIPTVEKDGGICYAHPQYLPGVKQDGSVSHFFHRAIKAYNTGTRKRRKINDDDLGDVRWHKTGRTKPVNLDGVQRGCKKIMVLYASLVRGGKPEKTNWVMHQYHLGTEEDEKDGEYVISKIFYQQQQQIKQSERIDDDLPEASTIVKVDPVTPTSATPVPPRAEKKISNFDPEQQNIITSVDPSVPLCDIGCIEDEALDAMENTVNEDQLKAENQADQMGHDNDSQNGGENQADQTGHNNDSQNGGDLKWSDSMSQCWLDSQQLKECLTLCDDLFQSQSPNRDGGENNKELRSKPHLSDYYANLGPEDLKKDLQECQELVLDPANIEIDTPDDFRLSQLEFGSQSSFLEWGGSKDIK